MESVKISQQTQPAITWSKLAIETLEQDVKYVQSKLAIKTSERCQWHRCGVFIVNFEHILHLFLVYLLLTVTR